MSQVCHHLLVIFLFCTQQQAWLFVVSSLVTKDVTQDDDKRTIIFLLFLVMQKITINFDSQSSYVPFKFNSSKQVANNDNKLVACYHHFFLKT
jgi:hypothetical protein